MKKYLWMGSVAALVAILFLIYLRPFSSHEDYAGQTPSIPTERPFEIPAPPKGLRKVVLLDVARLQTFVATNMSDAKLPVKVISIREMDQNTKASAKIETVLSGIALPIMHGRTYSGIVSLDARCTPPEPCKTRVMAPSQLGWSGPTTEEFKGKIRTILETQLRPPITDNDHVFAISWMTTDTNEQFTTYLVTTNEGRPIFEPMLWWSPGEKKCGEKPLPTVAQETSFEWNGYVRNAFGVEIISWKGHATYSYQNGKLLTPDPCPNRSCLNVKHDTFWQVDNDATVVKTQAFANRQPEEALLTYQIIWSVAFPKMDFDKFKLELPPPSGNAIAGSYAYRGDGTWNKNN